MAIALCSCAWYCVMRQRPPQATPDVPPHRQRCPGAGQPLSGEIPAIHPESYISKFQSTPITLRGLWPNRQTTGHSILKSILIIFLSQKEKVFSPHLDSIRAGGVLLLVESSIPWC